MNEELSLSRVVKALEKKLIEAPTPELLAAYASLLDRMNAPAVTGPDAALLGRVESLEGRVVFLEQLSKVRIVSGGKIA